MSEDAGDAVGGWNFELLVIMTNKREKRFLNMTLLNPLQLSSLSVFFHLIYITSFLSPGTAQTLSRQASSAIKSKLHQATFLRMQPTWKIESSKIEVFSTHITLQQIHNPEALSRQSLQHHPLNIHNQFCSSLWIVEWSKAETWKNFTFYESKDSTVGVRKMMSEKFI